MRRGLVGALVLSLAGCGDPPCRSVQSLPFEVRPRHAYDQTLPSASATLGVVGDVQRTSLGGCWLHNEVNDAEQRALLADLAAQKPEATVLLGDLVFNGGSSLHWAYFDDLIAASGLDRGSLFALPGNHDYFQAGNLRELKARFPRLRGATYDAFTWGSVRLILLDANRDELTASDWDEQLAWLEHELAAAEESHCTRGVIVFTHQAPFTQSDRVDEDEDLKRDVVPRFCKSRKQTAFISAHAHGYERWIGKKVAEGCGEKTPFIVSAGGGGPRPRKRRENAPKDDVKMCEWPAGHRFSEWPRPFNYLLLKQLDETLRIEVHALEKGEHAATLAETTDVPLTPITPADAAICAHRR